MKSVSSDDDEGDEAEEEEERMTLSAGRRAAWQRNREWHIFDFVIQYALN